MRKNPKKDKSARRKRPEKSPISTSTINRAQRRRESFLSRNSFIIEKKSKNQSRRLEEFKNRQEQLRQKKLINITNRENRNKIRKILAEKENVSWKRIKLESKIDEKVEYMSKVKYSVENV